MLAQSFSVPVRWDVSDWWNRSVRWSHACHPIVSDRIRSCCVVLQSNLYLEDTDEMQRIGNRWALGFVALSVCTMLGNLALATGFAVAGERMTRTLRNMAFNAMVSLSPYASMPVLFCWWRRGCDGSHDVCETGFQAASPSAMVGCRGPAGALLGLVNGILPAFVSRACVRTSYVWAM